MTFSGGQIDRSLTYNRINQAMITIGQADATDKSMPLQGRPVSSPLVDIGNGKAEVMEQAGSILPDGSDNSTAGGNLGEAAMEIIMQPHIVQSAGGGGGSNDRGGRDDDKEKVKNNRPYKRRR